MIILKKFEFDDDYDFDDEGEDEAMFLEYRKTLKMLFNAIAKMVSLYSALWTFSIVSFLCLSTTFLLYNTFSVCG